MQSELYETFFWALEDRGDCKVKEEDKEQLSLSREKRQGTLARGPDLHLESQCFSFTS